MRQRILLLLATLLVGCGESTGVQSSVATLSSLTVSTGTLTPAFSSSVYNYGVSVANSVTSITVTATATSGTATIKVRGTTVTSGSASPAQALSVGPNLIDVAVTADDGTLLIYDIAVTRN